jgi:hypothetical protein
MAYTYTRTVTVVPADDSYLWDKQGATWINIVQQGTSDTWDIEVLDNATSSSRSAVLSVNHSDGSTTNSITVQQAGDGGVQASPTPSPSASGNPPTPTPSNSPQPSPTPSPSSSTPLTPTFTFDTGDTPAGRQTMTGNDAYLDVSYTITNDGSTSPIAPSNMGVEDCSPSGWVSGANESGPTGTNDPTTFTGVYRFTKMQSGLSNTNVDCPVDGPYGTTDTWYVTLQFVSNPK